LVVFARNPAVSRVLGLFTAWSLGALSVELVLAQPGAKPSAPAPRPIEVKVPHRKEPVSYAKEVAAILDNRCVGCHSSALAENRLNLEDIAGMLKGGKRGPAIVPGKADESRLFQMAAHRVEPAMPPQDKPVNRPMTPEELGLLKLWIDAGARDDSAESEVEGHQAIELGELPPGVQPINAVDLTADGARVAAGRANVVQVYDVDSGLEIITLGGHKDLIQSLRFSPDGTLLAAGSYQIVTLWTVPGGGLVKSLAGHSGPVLALSVSPDGSMAYSGGQDKTIRVWSLAAGTLLRTLNQPAPVTALAVLPDGKSILSGGGDGRLRWLDASDGRERGAEKGHTAAVNGLAVLPASRDGTRFVSVSEDGTGRIGSLPKAAADGKADGKRAAVEPKAVVLNGHTGPVRGLGVTPDGQAIVTGGDDGTIRFWGARDGSPRGTIPTGHSGPILALTISPDGRTVLTGSADKSARLIALADGRVFRTLTGHAGPVRDVAFSPRGDRVATAGAEGGLKVWETASGRGVIAFGHTPPGGGALQPIHKVAFTAEATLISASADATLKTWSFAGAWTERRTLGSHVFRVLALDFSPDGRLLATGGGEPSRSGEIKIWELGKGLLGRSLPSLHSDTVFALRFSPDGTKLASAAADKFLKVTSLANGKLLRSLEGHTHHVMAVDWKSDGKQLISGGADNVLKLWDFDTGEQIRTLQAAGKQITAVRWIPGKPEVVGASGDALVRTWNPDSDGIIRTFSGPGDYVFSVATSADGTRIAAGGADSMLFIWNGQNGQVIRKLEPSPSPVTPAGSSPATAAK
jgi:WD40 repeat protein